MVGFVVSVGGASRRLLAPASEKRRAVSARKLTITAAWEQGDIWKRRIPAGESDKLEEVSRLPPLIYSGEVDRLKEKLAVAQAGNSFLMQIEDREEDFSITQGKYTESTFRLLVAQVIVLAYFSGLPVLKVNRIGGHFENVKSVDSEDEVNKVTEAYFQASSALNLLRAVAKSSKSVLEWSDYMHSLIDDPHAEFLARVEDSICFVQALGLNVFNEDFREPEFYVSHELQLLPFEEALTMEIEGKWYSTSTHMLWGKRGNEGMTKEHLQYMSEVENPVMLRVDNNTAPADLIEMINTVNPKNEPGKITLNCSFGSVNIWRRLPELIRTVKESELQVLWVCDPMTENTIPTDNGCLTCPMELVGSEISSFFIIHVQEGTFPGGVFLEQTGDDVNECIGEIKSLKDSELLCEYAQNRAGPQSFPRLNKTQAMNVAFDLAKLLRQLMVPGERLRMQKRS